jgi:hypothetical protein
VHWELQLQLTVCSFDHSFNSLESTILCNIIVLKSTIVLTLIAYLLGNIHIITTEEVSWDIHQLIKFCNYGLNISTMGFSYCLLLYCNFQSMDGFYCLFGKVWCQYDGMYNTLRLLMVLLTRIPGWSWYIQDVAVQAIGYPIR